jgi:GxxExxY protein
MRFRPGAEAQRSPEAAEDSLNTLSGAVIGAAIEVHKHLGPGHAESVYEQALVFEMNERGIPFARQSSFEISYKQRPVGVLRMDLVVDGRIIVELKSVETVLPIHAAQCIGYLSATGLPLCLLINFNSPILTKSIKRIINPTRTPRPLRPSAPLRPDTL